MSEVSHRRTLIIRRTVLVESGEDEQLCCIVDLRSSFNFILPVGRIFYGIGSNLYFLELVVGPELMGKDSLLSLNLCFHGAMVCITRVRVWQG